MEVSVKTKEQKRKLVAVVGVERSGVFFKQGDKIVFLGLRNTIEARTEKSLEELLSVSARRPVYEGDEITIKF